MSVCARRHILGVMRDHHHSPNNASNDAAIMEAVANCLRTVGFGVTLCPETELPDRDIAACAVMNMCRLPESLHVLRSLQQRGIAVVNSPQAIENCNRIKLCELLNSNGVETAPCVTCTLPGPVPEMESHTGFWLKNADTQAAMRADDIVYCRDRKELVDAVGILARRGVTHAVICRHIPGDLIKFYGVAGESFFYWFYPTASGRSKFGHEHINGPARERKFDEGKLRELCGRAACAVGIDIYGGDCIVADDGRISIIDLNDWPSFSPCRDAAAPHIADCILKKITE